MPREHLPAAARCRQLERLVAQHPGATVTDLLALVPISYWSVCAYMRRLVREQRVRVVLDDPAMGAKAQQRFYPAEEHPRVVKAA